MPREIIINPDKNMRLRIIASLRSLVLLSRHSLLAGTLALTGQTGHAAELPKLVVAIALDQFRQEYLDLFRPHFVADGFNLFLEHGAVFADCHYRHSYTKTGPGHGVLLSGVHADIHGIIANDWFDRDTLMRVYCSDDPTERVVGLAPPQGAVRPGDRSFVARSPRSYMATTIGDQLKLSTGGRAKVIGLSNKDRAAILMAGHLANAAYYTEGNRFVSSTYYLHELPEWVQQFNAAGKMDAYFGRMWDRLLPVEAYESIQGSGKTPNRFGKLGLSLDFPKIVNGGEARPGAAFYEALNHTPFANEILADFACTAVKAEQLGKRGVTDLLAVSFSATDLIGHDHGPDSHEVMDIVLRTDRQLAEFFRFLDDWVGLKHCLIVLSADHGAAPMPERLQALRPSFPAGRIDPQILRRTGEAALNSVFGPLGGPNDRWLVADGMWLLFDKTAFRQKRITQQAAEEVVRTALLGLSFVEAVYTRTQLENRAVDTHLGRRALLSFNRARSGDIFCQQKPFWIDFAYGTSHGSPYNYDTHVPLLWFGVGVSVGRRAERVGVDDLAPTLAHLLGLAAPPYSEGRSLF